MSALALARCELGHEVSAAAVATYSSTAERDTFEVAPSALVVRTCIGGVGSGIAQWHRRCIAAGGGGGGRAGSGEHRGDEAGEVDPAVGVRGWLVYGGILGVSEAAGWAAVWVEVKPLSSRSRGVGCVDRVAALGDTVRRRVACLRAACSRGAARPGWSQAAA